ncbi:MAG: hypothetical protein IJ688_10480 [Treponema sp.]|nr:hypothetical protein [Treponema sp.]
MSFAFLSAIGGLASPIVSCKIHKDEINHKNEQISMEINELEYSIKEIEKNIDILTNNDALLYNKINNLDKVYPNQVNVDVKIKE